MVGIRTSMAMACGSPQEWAGCGHRCTTAGWFVSSGNARSPCGIPCPTAQRGLVVDDGGRRVAEQVGLDDLDVLLGDGAVDDPEAAELDVVPGQAGLPLVVPRRDQH